MKSRTHGWIAAAAALALISAGGCQRNRAEQTTAATNNQSAQSNSPDWWTTTKVQAKFFADKDVKGHHVNVDTKDGVVTLSGTVDSQAARDRAEQIARNTDGVKDVRDNLAVASSTVASGATPNGNAPVATSGHTGAPETLEPAWITTKIQAKYFANPSLKPWNIDVTTMSDGSVTLNGSVDTDSARAEAERIARGTEGVNNVDNRLRVAGANATPGSTPQQAITEPDAWLTAKVQSKFFGSDLVKGRDINVDTTDGVVTLSGTVDSPTERDEADALARSTNGVKDVHDNLTVEVAPASAHLNPVQSLPQPNRVSTDDWITTRVRSRFFIDPRVKNMNVDVTTDNGIVTLRGQVADANAKAAAESIASHIEGVKQVKNELTIK
ncbi:MAG TPA: BON domain-containing protein [Vicinamibacterales bacterium]|jgi:hyperosmotically inducible periplasmic protein|nr:BON domain-containing protein [Vicinamibacterales bacterium]